MTEMAVKGQHAIRHRSASKAVSAESESPKKGLSKLFWLSEREKALLAHAIVLVTALASTAESESTEANSFARRLAREFFSRLKNPSFPEFANGVPEKYEEAALEMIEKLQMFSRIAATRKRTGGQKFSEGLALGLLFMSKLIDATPAEDPLGDANAIPVVEEQLQGEVLSKTVFTGGISQDDLEQAKKMYENLKQLGWL